MDDSPTECDTVEDASEGEAAAAAQPAVPAASGDDPPVWGQVDDDLVAPEGLIGDDDDDDDDDEEEEDEVAEAAPDESSSPSAGPREDEAPLPPAHGAAGVGSATAPATAPRLELPCFLLAAVLAVQIVVAVWSQREPHTAALLPVFGYAVMLLLGVGALYGLGRGATDKVGLRPFTSFQFLLLLFAAAPASILAAQAGNLIASLCNREAFPSWLRPPVPDELPTLALAIAGLCVVPALAQELVFRGIIGRAFIARFGPLNGMLLTSLAFAACAVFPQWVAKAFVLAIIFQVVFAATRSLAAAIVLNALCAATSIVVERFPDALEHPRLHAPPRRSARGLGAISGQWGGAGCGGGLVILHAHQVPEGGWKTVDSRLLFAGAAAGGRSGSPAQPRCPRGTGGCRGGHLCRLRRPVVLGGPARRRARGCLQSEQGADPAAAPPAARGRDARRPDDARRRRHAGRDGPRWQRPARRRQVQSQERQGGHRRAAAVGGGWQQGQGSAAASENRHRGGRAKARRRG